VEKSCRISKKIVYAGNTIDKNTACLRVILGSHIEALRPKTNLYSGSDRQRSKVRLS